MKLLNLQHPNIPFTMYKSLATTPFLDVEIEINNNVFDLWGLAETNQYRTFVTFLRPLPKKLEKRIPNLILRRAKALHSSEPYI